MSITQLQESEEILLKDSKQKQYKQAVKNRLLELIKEGDEEAQKEYNRVFPKFSFKASNKEDKQYDSRVLGRKQENIPYIVCKTCGKITDHVLEYQDPSLISEKRKTWKRVIKPTLSYFIYLSGRKRRNRRLFFSYAIMNCLKNKHKLQLKFKEHKTLVEMGYDYLRSRV
jgi:hypothetical protein